MKKRILATTIAVALLASLFTGCGGDGSSSKGESSTGESSGTESSSVLEEKDPNGKYDPPITITTAKPAQTNMEYSNNQTVDNNVWLDEIKERYGIIVEHKFTATGEDYATKVNTSIASGDIPDFMEYNIIQIKQLYDAGLLADMTTPLAEYGTDLTKELLVSDGGQAVQSGTLDDQLVGIPQVCDPRPGVMFLRYDWLEKLGIEEPKTQQDVIEIAKAFTDQDPDGNGKKDTYGLAISSGMGDSVGGLSYFFNAYHAYPSHWYKADDGSIKYGSIEPEMKDALAVLSQMYKEGYLDKEFVTKDGGKLGEDFAAQKSGMVYGQWWLPTWPLQSSYSANPDIVDWRAYPIMSNDENPAKPQYYLTANNWTGVQADCKNPEAVIKMLNLWCYYNYDQSATMEEYRKFCFEENGANIFQLSPIITWIGKDDRNVRIKEALAKKDPAGLTIEEVSYYDQILQFKAGGHPELWLQDANYGEFGAQQIMSNVYFNGDGNVTPTGFWGAPTETMSDKDATLKKMESEIVTKIIMGNEPVEAFDAFVEQWKALGGQDMINEVNEWAKENNN